jgi:phosphate-selective porin OprO and OprP
MRNARPRRSAAIALLGALLLLSGWGAEGHGEEGDGDETAQSAGNGNGDENGGGDNGFCALVDRLGLIYRSEDNPYLQRLKIKGGMDLQYVRGHSDAGRYGTENLPDEERWGPIELRRFRLGWEMDFLENFIMDAQFNLGARPRHLYGDIYQFYVEWNRHEAFRLAVGKFRVPFTQEYTIPDSRIVTIERSLLVETLLAPSLTGATVAGDLNGWSYHAGAYAGDDRDEFSRFNEGAVLMGKLGYDLSERVQALDRLEIGADYLLNSSPSNTAPAPYRHAVALYSDLELGKVNVLAEAIYARGMGRVPDLYGVNLIPTWFVHGDKVQLVGRYQFAISDGDGGLRLHPRYERLAPGLEVGGIGRRYHALYGGINWYFCHPEVKLMTGVEYHRMDGGRGGDDFSGVTLATSFRFWF